MPRLPTRQPVALARTLSSIDNFVPSANEVIVSGFLSMAAGLGVAVVAEGIETAGQLAILQRLGCTHGQGFYFGRAGTFEELRSRVHDETARRTAANEQLRHA